MRTFVCLEIELMGQSHFTFLISEDAQITPALEYLYNKTGSQKDKGMGIDKTWALRKQATEIWSRIGHSALYQPLYIHKQRDVSLDSSAVILIIKSLDLLTTCWCQEFKVRFFRLEFRFCTRLLRGRALNLGTFASSSASISSVLFTLPWCGRAILSCWRMVKIHLEGGVIETKTHDVGDKGCCERVSTHTWWVEHGLQYEGEEGTPPWDH